LSDFSFNALYYSNSLIGILLIIVGVIFLLNFTNLNIKIGASLILIGTLLIMFFYVNEKTIIKSYTGQEVFFIFAIWLFISLIITYNIDADIFLIVVILGIIALREFLFGSVSPRIEKRLNILFYGLLILFILIISQRIINILDIWETPMKTITINYPLDIFLCLVYSLLLIPVILLDINDLLRMVLGLPFLLFIPGYLFLLSVAPNHSARSEIEAIHKIAISIGLSIALVSLDGILLFYSPLGFNLLSIVVSLFLIVLVCGLVAIYRRRKLQKQNQFALSLNVPPLRQNQK